MVPIPDDELERLAAERPPAASKPTRWPNCAQDKKVSTHRLGDFIVIGPEPTPQDEVVFMLANEAAKHLRTMRCRTLDKKLYEQAAGSLKRLFWFLADNWSERSPSSRLGEFKCLLTARYSRAIVCGKIK